MIAVISVDAYPFLISQTWPVNLRVQEQVFPGCTKPPDSKETELGSSDQEASPSAGKNARIVLVPCHAWSVSLQLFLVVWIFPRSQGVSCYDRSVLSEGHKYYFKDWCLMISQLTFLFLTQWVMAILSKGCKTILLNENHFLNQTILTFLL